MANRKLRVWRRSHRIAHARARRIGWPKWLRDRAARLHGLIAREDRKQARQYRRRFRPSMLNGHSGNVSRACKRMIVRGYNAGLVVTSTTGGDHADTSYHYSRDGKPGRAVDFGLEARLVGTAEGQHRLESFQRSEAKRPGRFRELFGPANDACVKNGAQLTLAEGSDLEEAHDNHVHGAPRW